MIDSADFLDAIVHAPEHSVANPVIFDDLAEPEDRKAFPQSRIRAARSWLYALGYLSDDDDAVTYDDELRAGIEWFQREAGLTVDGWIGSEETWPRLQELVAFESSFQSDHWVGPEGEPRPALKRAVKTRLALYGFGSPSSAMDEARLSREIESFNTVMNYFVDTPVGAHVDPDVDQFEFVLSHDKHIETIVEGYESALGSARDMIERKWPYKEALKTVGFMLNLTKVELWLSQVAGVKLTVRHRGWVVENYEMPRNLLKGMRQCINRLDDASEEARDLKSEFEAAEEDEDTVGMVLAFLRATKILADFDQFSDDRVEELNQFYGGTYGEERADATHRKLSGSSGLRSRLWDGIGRLWGWIKRAIKTAIAAGKRALQLAKDVARYAFQVASRGLFQVAKVIESFVKHMSVATQRTNVESGGRVIVRRDFSRDADLIISADAPAIVPALYAKKLETSARIFSHTCNVLGALVRFGISIAKGVIAPPLVMRSLIWFVREARGTIDKIARIIALESRHEFLEKALAKI
jgi:hypothetical protein